MFEGGGGALLLIRIQHYELGVPGCLLVGVLSLGKLTVFLSLEVSRYFLQTAAENANDSGNIFAQIGS